MEKSSCAFLMLLLTCGVNSVRYDPRLGESSGEFNVSGVLGPGDILEIRVYREQDLSGIFQVSPEGTIDYPLLGTVKVEGLTSSKVAATIREGLAKGYLANPFVTVTIKELNSKKIYVLGQVMKPGTFLFQEGMSVIQAISLAGGFTKMARPNAVVVTRTEGGKEIRTIIPANDIAEGKEKNFYLKPGDIVFVPESLL